MNSGEETDGRKGFLDHHEYPRIFKSIMSRKRKHEGEGGVYGVYVGLRELVVG